MKESDFYYISKESHRSDPWRDRTEGESGRNFGKFIQLHRKNRCVCVGDAGGAQWT